jgi:hypothetical protein
MSRADFVKLQAQASVWKVFSRIVEERIGRLSKHIVKSSLAEAQILNSIDNCIKLEVDNNDTFNYRISQNEELSPNKNNLSPN